MSIAVYGAERDGGFSTTVAPERNPLRTFPPTAESTMASRVVGTWQKRIPRMKVAATKPTRSPMTPPPRARTTVSLVQRCESKKSSSSAFVARLLLCSPGGMTWVIHRGRVSVGISAMALSNALANSSR